MTYCLTLPHLQSSHEYTPDQLRHETPHLSSYLYCAGNPVMLTDPSGMSTRVVDNGNGTYRVVGGALDGDLRIFLCESVTSETGIPIGMTPVETSFYNSDNNPGEEWMVGAIIDPSDNSGIEFITSIIDDTPGNWEYARNAYKGKLYGFKRTNGTPTKDDDFSTTEGLYRGMPVPIGSLPMLTVYCSARDIGNMMAGYVTGYNGLPWCVVRFFSTNFSHIKKARVRLRASHHKMPSALVMTWDKKNQGRIERAGIRYVPLQFFHKTIIVNI